MISRVLPSVVNVRVTEISTDPFGGTQSGQAEGSGVVLSKDGLIVTNAHVVSSATSVKVFFTNGHEPLDGTVLGVDATHDLAVIKVQASDLKPITIGHSGTLKLVDDVYAIGFPLDLGPTVTRGVISGLDRTINVQRPDGSTEHLEGLLQTDAAINPGNSGGALIDAAGQLVGINTAGASAGEAENVGFAIAIDGAVPIIHQLTEGNSSTQQQQAWLGVQVAADSDREAALSQLGLPADLRGAIVEGVVPNGPAQGAGIKQGDVIVQLGDSSIQSDSDLTAALADQKPGDEVQVRLQSTDGQRTVTVTLGTRPAGLG
jgi:putative serine protease PepD